MLEDLGHHDEVVAGKVSPPILRRLRLIQIEAEVPPASEAVAVLAEAEGVRGNPELFADQCGQARRSDVQKSRTGPGPMSAQEIEKEGIARGVVGEIALIP